MAPQKQKQWDFPEPQLLANSAVTKINGYL